MEQTTTLTTEITCKIAGSFKYNGLEITLYTHQNGDRFINKSALLDALVADGLKGPNNVPCFYACIGHDHFVTVLTLSMLLHILSELLNEKTAADVHKRINDAFDDGFVTEIVTVPMGTSNVTVYASDTKIYLKEAVSTTLPLVKDNLFVGRVPVCNDNTSTNANYTALHREAVHATVAKWRMSGSVDLPTSKYVGFVTSNNVTINMYLVGGIPYLNSTTVYSLIKQLGKIPDTLGNIIIKNLRSPIATVAHASQVLQWYSKFVDRSIAEKFSNDIAAQYKLATNQDLVWTPVIENEPADTTPTNTTPTNTTSTNTTPTNITPTNTPPANKPSAVQTLVDAWTRKNPIGTMTDQEYQREFLRECNVAYMLMTSNTTSFDIMYC